ncbi:hypothetical protein DN730_16750 [Marinomonas piezotolerans]|uniref:Acyloxyacyl hydrolase n=1 Tax=Marinomonas piezotolerans TaxID=2213058 RepID=A0A370U5C3_9GAMM|nr:acyloxyacyl hydrolase [Marinomonas piezotolerans]RDL42979.1 hypothetical protein DN730_16750 [Marinomonas piezotolerans]
MLSKVWPFHSLWKKWLKPPLALTVIGLSTLSTQAVYAEDATIWRTAMGASIVATALTNALGADSMLLELGTGNDIYFARYSARWYADNSRSFGSKLTITPSLQVGYSKWQSGLDKSSSATNNVVDLLPVFRWEGGIPFVSFIDTGVGLSLFSNNELAGRKFGGPLQFNNYLGLGWRFGEQHNWEASVHFQHYSNNNIYDDNNGVNFTHLSIGYTY